MKLLCHCDHCLNNTCIAENGICYAQLVLDRHGEVQKKYNCFNHNSPLFRNLICDQKNGSLIVCCQTNYCNLNDTLLPSHDEAKSILLASRVGGEVSDVHQRPTVPLDLRLVFLVISGLLFVVVVQNFLSGKRKKRIVEEETSHASLGSGSGQPYLTQRSIAHDIELVEVVGRGYFGVVWRAKYRGEPVAVKIFSPTAEPSWRREVEIYQTRMLRHKNILGFIATDKKDGISASEYWLVTDYYPIGSLFDFLRSSSMSMPDAVKMAFSIANGLAHLHIEILGLQGKPAIAHRDLKSKNILIKNDGTCCISDLGMAVRFDSQSRLIDAPSCARVGTRRYLAPELLENKLDLTDFEAVKATDVYALGLVLWELLRRTCYVCPSAAGVGDSTVCDPYEAPYQGLVPTDPTTEEMRQVVCYQNLRPPLSYRWTKLAPMQDYATLMSECWYGKPQARLSALRIRKTLSEIGRRYFNLNMESD